MTTLLVSVTGRDRPGIAADLFDRLSPLDLEIRDVEQLQIHGRLLLCVLLDGAVAGDLQRVQAALVSDASPPLPSGIEVSVAEVGERAPTPRGERHLVTILGNLPADRLAALFETVGAVGANVDRIVRLARYPVTSYELTISGGDPEALRREVAVRAAEVGVDAAVQRAGLHRRSKHLIVLDVDSTLVQGEIVDLLAAKAGCLGEVQAITAAAMAGEVDFESALRQRVALLAGLDALALDQVRRELALTPGARTLVRTLGRLGYVTALVSGGFVEVIQPLVHDLGIDFLAANTLEIRDGRLTGHIVGPVVDRAGKASALARFAAEARVPLARTVAVGDGANDLDMLAMAGLGIAFNAKQVVRDAADAALNVPYLDAILFLLGIPREEVEAADADDGAVEAADADDGAVEEAGADDEPAVLRG